MADEDTSPVLPPAEEPVIPPPEAAPAPTTPEVTQNEPVVEAPLEPAPSAQGFGGPTQTAQMGRNEPLPATSEPFDSAHDKPLPEQQPAPQPSAPVSVVAPIVNLGRDVLSKARATIQSRKKIKLEKIMTELEKKGKVTNDEVEKLLHVSDATATRYLSALEKDGKIKQVGKTGIGVVYEKI
ncbi:MAG: winged helix-turn-helix transcriptional regulator [bacterium]|nr:winged helix-turn-helix transcriptional regulator [bacterium]